MAERFQKIYISVNEFISSWEKEVYELTNLDYFTFLLINNLGYQIEHEFLKRLKDDPHLLLEPDEIGTLSFNIGDSLESFLQDNCFGNCTLSCPTKLEEMPEDDEMPFSAGQHYLFQILGGGDWKKRQFLVTDILNYVVLDTLFDFYNYEIGVDLNETDLGLLNFADFIADIIEKMIGQEGQKYLSAPGETATHLFDNLLEEGSDKWDESQIMPVDDEEEEPEFWKQEQQTIRSLIAEYIEQLPDDSEIQAVEKLLGYFKRYDEEYAGIIHINELAVEDLKEFFNFWLVRELSLESDITITDIEKHFRNFFNWLEISHDIHYTSMLSKIIRTDFPDIEKALLAVRTYFNRHSLIHQIIESQQEDHFLAGGYFRIERVSSSGLLRLTNVHLHKNFINVQVDSTVQDRVRKGFILEGRLKPTSYGWRLVQLEYIFPPAAFPYIH